MEIEVFRKITKLPVKIGMFIFNFLRLLLDCIIYFPFVHNLIDEEDEILLERGNHSDRLVDKNDYAHGPIVLKTTDPKINFSMRKAALLVTDIVGNTIRFNRNPLKMKKYVLIHYCIVHTLIRKYSGHIVANEGDSFHLLFENLDKAIQFYKEFDVEHKEKVPYFEVRAGIAQGSFDVKNIDGIKIFGSCVNDILGTISHNSGKKVCIKRKVLDNSKVANPCSLFCIH